MDDLLFNLPKFLINVHFVVKSIWDGHIHQHKNGYNSISELKFDIFHNSGREISPYHTTLLSHKS